MSAPRAGGRTIRKIIRARARRSRTPPFARRKTPASPLQPLRCLANCKRGCTAVLRRTDPSAPAWTYVFGHLDPAADAQALVQGAKLLAGSADGLMPWRGRPDALKRGLIARVPPFDFSEQSE